MSFRISFIAAVAILWAGVRTADARVVTRTVEYRQGKTTLEGLLVYDDAVKGRRPAVLVTHEWWGLNDHTRAAAERLAARGYVAFAPDVFGKGVRPGDPAKAAEVAGKYLADRKLLRARMAAGLEQLTRQPQVDPQRVAVIGFCFGGSAALELARSGAPLDAVVVFHAGLATPTPADARNIQGAVLALQGGADSVAPPAQLTAFMQEMTAAKVAWRLVVYGGAAHAFTNPSAGSDPSKGHAYDAKATAEAWAEADGFLEERLAAKR